MRVFVADHAGMASSAIVRRMEFGPFDVVTRSQPDLDLCNRVAVDHCCARQQPDVAVCCAGMVGGIHANHAFPAEFAYDHLAIAANTIDAA